MKRRERTIRFRRSSRMPHQTIFGCYDKLNLAPFQGDSLSWMRSQGQNPGLSPETASRLIR
jgi:hypothetical protein